MTTSSRSLTVVAGDAKRVLPEGEGLTFGRDRTCDLCLDSSDRGISRLAGEIVAEEGTWWVINRSSKRALHIVDDAGLTVPLPVARAGWPSPRRAVAPPGLTVLVAGEVWTHELRLITAAHPESSRAPLFADPLSTSTHLGGMTENRREALVALVSGYLRPFPFYDPRPLTYAEAGRLLGLPASTVRKRIEAVRNELEEAGVAGLNGEDSPRRLSEWLLSTRVVVAEDLLWLESRPRHARSG